MDTGILAKILAISRFDVPMPISEDVYSVLFSTPKKANEWEYIFEVRRRFGFESKFLVWIKFLYKVPTALVLINGLLSAPFT